MVLARPSTLRLGVSAIGDSIRRAGILDPGSKLGIRVADAPITPGVTSTPQPSPAPAEPPGSTSPERSMLIITISTRGTSAARDAAVSRLAVLAASPRLGKVIGVALAHPLHVRVSAADGR